jgi:transketolase
MIEFSPKNIKRWMMMGTRNAFGAFLTDVAADHPELFAITADFTKSTGLAKFREQYPDQFLSAGIAEQNMVSLASGLASEGRNVFACSFASFATTRCYEQVKVNLGYMQHNVKLVGIASGLGVSHQGNTHYGLDDVSLMRAIPDMTIVVPSDCTEVAKAVMALADFNGPAYLRLVGEGFVPIINDGDYEFEIGKGIRKRDGRDVLIIANGTMVSQSLKVAEELSEQNGIEATVINMHTVKPLDTQIIGDYMRDKKLIVTIEEGQINGGLGSAVAEYVASVGNAPRMLRLGINDVFPHPGSYNYLLEQCGLDVESMKEKIINSIK